MLARSLTLPGVADPQFLRSWQGIVMSVRQLVDTVFRYGACVSSPRADTWFREEPRGRAALELQRRYARQACASCPVRRECLMVALSHEAESTACWGIWGGVCARDRQTALQHAMQDSPDGIIDVADVAHQLLATASQPTRHRSARTRHMATVDSHAVADEPRRLAS